MGGENAGFQICFLLYEGQTSSFQLYQIFYHSELRPFADNNSNKTQKSKLNMESIENLVGKRRKCWLPAFSPFPRRFSKAFSPSVVKTQDRLGKG